MHSHTIHVCMPINPHDQVHSPSFFINKCGLHFLGVKWIIIMIFIYLYTYTHVHFCICMHTDDELASLTSGLPKNRLLQVVVSGNTRPTKK